MKPRLPVVGPFRIDLGIGCGKGMFIAAVAGDQMHVGRDWRLLWDTSSAGRATCSANWTDVTLSRSGTVESPVTSRQGTPATSRAMSRAGLRSTASSETLRSPQSRPQEPVRPARWFSLRAVPVGWRRTDPAQKAEAGVLRPVGCHSSRENRIPVLPVARGPRVPDRT